MEKFETTKYDVALTAQDSKKWELVTLVEQFRQGLAQHSVVATLETGLFLLATIGMNFGLLLPGVDGGYKQIAEMVREEKVRLVIFLHGPDLNLKDHGVMELLRACISQNIPFANNATTAEFILQRFLEKEMATYWRCPEIRPDREAVEV